MDFLAILRNESIYFRRSLPRIVAYSGIIFTSKHSDSKPASNLSERLAKTTKSTLDGHKADLSFLPSPRGLGGTVERLAVGPSSSLPSRGELPAVAAREDGAGIPAARAPTLLQKPQDGPGRPRGCPAARSPLHLSESYFIYIC